MNSIEQYIVYYTIKQTLSDCRDRKIATKKAQIQFLSWLIDGMFTDYCLVFACVDRLVSE